MVSFTASVAVAWSDRYVFVSLLGANIGRRAGKVGTFFLGFGLTYFVNRFRLLSVHCLLCNFGSFLDFLEPLG